MRNTQQADRHSLIRHWLAQEGSLKVEDLVARLGVTSMTVRRDLAAMEEEGLLVRRHGACTYTSPMVRDLSFSEKDVLNARQKADIAREAVRLIEPGQSIYVDTGTTALHFARALPNTLNLRIFTNNLRVAMDLFSRDGFEVNVYGGRLCTRSPDLVGEMVLARAQEFRLDWAVIGADAVDALRGEVYAADIPTANIDRLVQSQAERLMVVADGSKLGKHSLALVVRLGEGVTLVTDDSAEPHDLVKLRRTGARVIVASSGENEYQAGPLLIANGATVS